MRKSREEKDPPFTEEEINNILNTDNRWPQHTGDKKPLDVFNLHGVLFVGNVQGMEWDLDKTYLRFSEHSVGLSITDFEDCITEADVHETFSAAFKERVNEKLI